MKVVFISRSFNRSSGGGVVSLEFELASELSRRGHEISILTSDAGRYESKSSDRRFDVFECQKGLEMGGLSFTPSFLKCIQQHAKSNCVMHMHEFRTYQNAVARSYCKSHRIPYILQAHGTLPRIQGKQGLKFLFDLFYGYRILKNASKLIALSNAEKIQYEIMGGDPAKISIIPNGINFENYKRLPIKGSFRTRFKIKDQTKLILYLGRLHRIKGLDVLIKSFANVKRELTDSKLVVAGPDDGYHLALAELAKDLNLQNEIIFTGPLYDEFKLQALVDSDVFLLPSVYEMFPMTVLEAYACKTPVIASRIGGLPEMVIDGETGILVDSRDPVIWGKQIVRLLKDNDTSLSMGSRGKSFVRKNFSIQFVANRFEKLYSSVF